MSAGQNKDEKKDILKTYFDGVIQHLQTEIDYVTKLIGHTGEMGRANEVILFNLLVKFLPKRYSVGSGIVIDKEGNRSKQIDIIIYDSYFQPELFAQSSTYLFPVDIVYMTIEVKTLLDKTRMSEALDNIASVKRLKFIETSIGFLQYHKPNTKIAASFNISKTRSPFGVIFSYKADTDDFNTYRSWLKPIEETKKNEIFDLSFCIGLITVSIILKLV